MMLPENKNIYLDNIANLSKAILYGLADSVAVSDEAGIIKWVNPAYENLTGYSLTELLDSNTNIIHSENSTSGDLNHLRDSVSKSNLWKSENWNKRKNGTDYFEEKSITQVKDENGVIKHYIATIRDITNQKKTTEQIDNAKRIEAIGQLTAGVAHNFNNKLASILGFSDLLLDEVQQYKNADIEDSINEIIIAGKSARDLVKQMMAFSVTTYSKAKPVDLHLAISQAIKIITSTLPAEINVLIELNEVPQVVIDPIQFHQMLVSLAVNASEAMHKKGQLTFSLSQLHFDAVNCSSCHDVISGDYVSVSVKDTGNGISTENIENIFLPFFTTRQDAGGTGMGLSALHGMLHDMQGHVLVESSLDEYTEFKLLLPIQAETEVNEKVVKQVDSSVIKRNIQHILLIDDDASVASFMYELLSLHGYLVTKETDSNAAYTLFLKDPNKYDLVLTDQSMPNLSGTELIKIIQEIRKDLPIILMTGYGEDNFSSESVKIHSILTKPFDSKILLSLIEQI